MPALIILAAATLATHGAPPDPPCRDDSTPGVERCLGERLAAADTDLARYVAAARARLTADSREDEGAARALKGFDAAERSWAAYRKAECGAVYEAWSGGTIRGAEGLLCELRLTRLHTHTIWTEWLTYMDSTPPILPEPPVAPE